MQKNRKTPMKNFALTLALFVVWSGPMEFGTESGSPGLDAGKSAASTPKSPEEQKKTGKDAVAQPQGKKKGAKKKEDCGCETTLFGEPVPQPVQKPAQGKAGRTEVKQTTKSKVKSDSKGAAAENSEKEPKTPADANQSKNLTIQPSTK